MSHEIIKVEPHKLAVQPDRHGPPVIIEAGRANARFGYDEFFAGEANDNTEKAYRKAVHRFLRHCETLGVPRPILMPLATQKPDLQA